MIELIVYGLVHGSIIALGAIGLTLVFGIIRFADGPGMTLTRLADDQIEGHDCHFIEVLDTAQQKTVFGIDFESSHVRSAAFDTEVGFQQRLYSEFAWADEGRAFLQPRRVRLFFDGAKWFDIHWERVVVNAKVPDGTFRIPEVTAER